MNPETLAWLELALLLYDDSAKNYPACIQSFLETQWRALVKLRLFASPEHCDRWIANQRGGIGDDLPYSPTLTLLSHPPPTSALYNDCSRPT